MFLNDDLLSLCLYISDGPYTVEKIFLACKTKIEDFKFHK